MLEAMGVADEIDPPRHYTQVPSVDAAGQETADLPAVGILSSGWSDAPERDEDGNLQITWRVNVVAFIRGDDYATTQRTPASTVPRCPPS
jgi:hypothetical protein